MRRVMVLPIPEDLSQAVDRKDHTPDRRHAKKLWNRTWDWGDPWAWRKSRHFTNPDGIRVTGYPDGEKIVKILNRRVWPSGKGLVECPAQILYSFS
ncbi:MAG: hypothetical protein L0387_04240 [Acidobacteria bacterium]|nr:hypothetical protein [Acidobacteriota bacterium]